MTFGILAIAYSNLYLHDYETYADENGLASTGDSDDKIFAARGDIKTKVVIDGASYGIYTSETDNAGTDAVAPEDVGGPTFGGSTEAADGTDGTTFTANANATMTVAEVYKQEGQLLYSASEGLSQSVVNTDLLIDEIEAVQAKINTARVQAGSQYAALESAVAYTTDLTAQYELGYNVVNDVNFSMETAHLAKNQILQQAATAMLAQANSGQQSLLQLIQG